MASAVGGIWAKIKRRAQGIDRDGLVSKGTALLTSTHAAAVFGAKSVWDDIRPQDTQSVTIGLWFIGSILLLFSNRYIFLDLEFKSPITLATFQALFTTIITRGFHLQLYLGGQQQERRATVSWAVYMRWVVPTGICIGVATIGIAVSTNYLPLVSTFRVTYTIQMSRTVVN